MNLRSDFHIHSCLSPCGSLEMSPRRIVEEALRHRLDVIALTDHNSALNCPTLASLVEDTPLLALYGLEITSVEEVHVLALFADVASALSLGEWVYDALPPFIHNPQKFGDQVYVDTNDVVIGHVNRYLVQACQHTIEDVVLQTHQRQGLVIPAHIDRLGSGLLDNLGFLLAPEQSQFDAVELTKYYWHAPTPIDNLGDYACIVGSDTHYPEGIGSVVTIIEAEEKSFQGIKNALKEKKVTISLEESSVA